MDDSLNLSHETLDSEVFAGLISSRVLEESGVTAEEVEALEREAADCRRMSASKKKLKAIRRHDADMDRLIALFVEGRPYYEHIEY
jgi:hypothetical protein